jgi:glycosyltransferase involved in cell wall biosynthesis
MTDHRQPLGRPTRWMILTGEYPPQSGGVSDYTQLVARELAGAGDEVHIWAPAFADATPALGGVIVHRLPDHFGWRGLAHLRAGLRSGDRLLVQYVPQMYGCRGMNLPLCLWLRYACPVRPWVMFHEVASPVLPGQPLRHRVQALVQRRMAVLVARSAERVFVSTPAWEPQLARFAPGCSPIWLPVPSNLPHAAGQGAAAEVRRGLGAGDDTLVVGHFGTFNPLITVLLEEVFPRLLAAEPGRIGLLIGLGGEAFAARLLARYPALHGRIRATGLLPLEEIAAHLAACDLLVQPYPDGVSTRRTSLMAGLALGRPIVTTRGELTEPLWLQSGTVALEPAGVAPALLDAAEALLHDPRRREQLGASGRAFYAEHFSPQRLIATLRRHAGAAPTNEDNSHGNVVRACGPDAALLGACGGGAARPLTLGAADD